jgi:NADH-ubiquinone oxidoreductase chain 6
MSSLYLISETFVNGYKIFFLDIVSIAAIFSGILVIISKNPIVSVLYLIGLFSSISVYLICIGLNFIGLSYLLVYIGAISILFLFILMLINIRISELLSDSNNSIPLIIIVTIYMFYYLNNILSHTSLNNSKLNFNNVVFNIYEPIAISSEPNNLMKIFYDLFVTNDNKYEIGYITSKLWDGFLSENSHIASIGNVIYTNYSMWLILTSIILLLAMVGCIIITIKQGNKD